MLLVQKMSQNRLIAVIIGTNENNSIKQVVRIFSSNPHSAHYIEP
jgi:hypothetical protein